MARNPIIREPNQRIPADQEHGECFAYYSGVVYIGHMVESEANGEEVEVIEAVPCRRCADSR